MNSFTPLSLIFALFLLVPIINGYGQSLEVGASGPAIVVGDQGIFQNAPVSVTQSANMGVITPGISPSCGLGSFDGRLTHFYRRFDLDGFQRLTSFAVTSIDWGMERLQRQIGASTADVTFLAYYLDPSLPLLVSNLSSPIRTVDYTGLVTNLPRLISTGFSTGPLDLSKDLVIELRVNRDSFKRQWVASNNLGETTGSFLMAPDCGLTTPTSMSAAGFPNTHWMLLLNGEGERILPVELTSLNAILQYDGSAVISWTTASELNNQGFEIEWSNDLSSFSTLGFVSGKGSTTSESNYDFRTEELEPGIHAFRLKQIDFDGVFEYSDVMNLTVPGKSSVNVLGVYPNPTNGSAFLRLVANDSQEVRISLTDMMGRQVKTWQSIYLNAEGLSEFPLALEGIVKGSYMISVTGERSVEWQKIQVVH